MGFVKWRWSEAAEAVAAAAAKTASDLRSMVYGRRESESERGRADQKKKKKLGGDGHLIAAESKRRVIVVQVCAELRERCGVDFPCAKPSLDFNSPNAALSPSFLALHFQQQRHPL